MLWQRRTRLLAVAAATALAVAAATMASPPDARAQIDLTPGLSIPNPLDALPNPADLVGSVFEFFFKTFFGIEAGSRGVPSSG